MTVVSPVSVARTSLVTERHHLESDPVVRLGVLAFEDVGVYLDLSDVPKLIIRLALLYVRS